MNIFKQSRQKVFSLSVLILTIVGFLGIYQIKGSSGEFRVTQEFSLDSYPLGEKVGSVYVRNISCIKVNRVNLQLLNIKSGQTITYWNGEYKKVPGDQSPSSSCLLVLLAGGNLEIPLVSFSFARTSVSSGEGFEPPNPSNRDTNKVKSTKLSSWQLVNTVWTVPPETKLEAEKPQLVYIKAYGNSKSLKNLRQPTSLAELQKLSHQYKDLEFLTINISWAK